MLRASVRRRLGRRTGRRAGDRAGHRGVAARVQLFVRKLLRGRDNSLGPLGKKRLLRVQRGGGQFVGGRYLFGGKVAGGRTDGGYGGIRGFILRRRERRGPRRGGCCGGLL